MRKSIARKLAVGLTLAALITPMALAASPIGTDPEPEGTISVILAFLGLA
jgi:hypothetical protein